MDITLDFRRECILFDALEDVRLDYDYILLDCMASLGMLAVNVMMACDTVLLVSTPEEDSIEGLELASDFIQEAARALRKEIPVCGVLICRVDMRYRKSRSGVERIRQLFVPQYPIYQEMIPDRVCVADARNKQVSIIDWGYGRKYDFRKWTEDYDKCSKGICLSQEEVDELISLLKSI